MPRLLLSIRIFRDADGVYSRPYGFSVDGPFGVLNNVGIKAIKPLTVEWAYVTVVKGGD